jgi:hydroxypyruvate isomerase
MEFIKDMVDLEQELISKFNLSNSTPISKVSELFNYENQKEKIQQVLLHEQLNSYLFSNTILKKDM